MTVQLYNTLTRTKEEFIQNLFQQGIKLSMFMDYLPSLQEIFIEKAGAHNEAN